jgi:hypothetical protein
MNDNNKNTENQPTKGGQGTTSIEIFSIEIIQ